MTKNEKPMTGVELYGIEIKKAYDAEITRKAADICFANFEAESRRALEQQPEAAAMIEQQLSAIRTEIFDHILPEFDFVYRDARWHDRTIANQEAERRVRRYGKRTEQICNLYMRELAKLPNRI